MIRKCRVCHSVELVSIIDLGPLYLSDFRKDDKKPPRYPLHLVLCKKCSLVQLKHTAPMNILYSENYGYKSGINDTMTHELKEIAENALQSHISSRDLTILDIGANDGTLLKNYSKKHFRVGIEPIKKFAKECKQYADIVINDFFSAENYTKKVKRKADIITAISCFYDIDNPVNFVKGISDILAKDGFFVVQQNYLVDMLTQNAFDNIVHEHLEYYSIGSLEYLFKKAGMEIFDVSHSSINGGSFRTYIAPKGTRKKSHSVQIMREKEKKMKLNSLGTYKHFAKNIKNNGTQIRNFIKKQIKNGKRVYVYGASTRGNTLLQNYGLDNSIITAAIERNPEKWGGKISSVGIPIISEEQARKEKPEYMLVLPWFFKEEFLIREAKYLRNGGHFIFPLPKMEII